MLKEVSKLKEAYDFYKKVEHDNEAILCGCLTDAEKWLWKELDALFLGNEKEE